MDATIRRLPRLDRVKLIKSLCIAELVLWVACTAMAGSGGHDTGHGSSHDAGSHAVAATHASAAEKTADTHAAASVHEQERAHEAASHGQESHAGDAGHGQVMLTISQAPGVATVEAAISNLDYELNERFWGWRPNDIFSLGDNVVNFQLGVLEVTRRTTVNLAERISRTGSTAAFDTNLENAMNWFMIKATDYWLPSAESKYSEGLEALQAFADALNRGEARFHTRTDNLIPLLRDFSDLLGSCDENLVKHYEDDGSHVSAFKADDYFFYAKGVASAPAGSTGSHRNRLPQNTGGPAWVGSVASCH